MELLKPIIVKRWVSEIKYIEYIFDNNVDNKYDNDVIIIPEYIFQDDNKKDALNKIAYHIYNYEKKNLTFPYYCWDDISKKSLLFDIKNIHWSGYNINPFKSKDKKDITNEIYSSLHYTIRDLLDITKTQVQKEEEDLIKLTESLCSLE